MKANNFMVCVALICIVYIPAIVNACKCKQQKTNQEKFCESALAIKGLVKAKKHFVSFPSEIRYKVRVLDFKDNLLKTVNIWSARGSAACGIDRPEIGKTYIFTTSKSGQRHTIDICNSWVEEWDSLLESERHGIIGGWSCT